MKETLWIIGITLITLVSVCLLGTVSVTLAIKYIERSE